MQATLAAHQRQAAGLRSGPPGGTASSVRQAVPMVRFCPNCPTVLTALKLPPWLTSHGAVLRLTASPGLGAGSALAVAALGWATCGAWTPLKVSMGFIVFYLKPQNP
jgi:hypothetical protein